MTAAAAWGRVRSLSRSPTGFRLALSIALAAYAARVTVESIRHRDWINPDAVSYLRNALYVTEGRIQDSISGYWSPLLSWCTAALMALGMQDLYAARVALALWGAVLVAATYVLIRRFTSLKPGLALLALLLVAESTVTWATTIFPDVILAACLMAYGATLVRSDFAERRSVQLLCGAWAGAAFLGKAYALPFFAVHLPLSLALLHRIPAIGDGRAGERPVPARRLASIWLCTTIGFAALCVPWIAALSIKYHRLTFGDVGRINHAVIGPDHPERHGLWEPVAGRVTDWEIPESRDYVYWSPFDSLESLEYQSRYTWSTARKIRASLAEFDYFSLALTFSIIAPFLTYALDRRREFFQASWVLATIAVLCSGYAFVYFTYRYTFPFLKPLCIVAAFQLTCVVGQRLREVRRPGMGTRGGVALARALTALLALSFAAHVNYPFVPYTVEEPNGTPFDDVTIDSGPHRALAERLRQAGCRGPIASTLYWAGMYVAYHAGDSFLGSPECTTVAACESELARRDVGTFLAGRDWALAESFRESPRFRLEFSVEPVAGEWVDIYVPAGEE
jgi:4-amino-4-deoxy-L-arabinose transferase-like glycosyltransferase